MIKQRYVLSYKKDQACNLRIYKT